MARPRVRFLQRTAVAAIVGLSVAASVAACGSSDSKKTADLGEAGAGGTSGAGAGGKVGAGGTSGNGGSSAAGGTSVGGTSSKGGASGAGGVSGSGGVGNAGAGGSTSKGGASPTGGAGGATSAGGTTSKGGATSAGGTSAGGTSAGGTSAGGTNAGGTNAGGTSTGGTSTGGTSTGGTSAGGTSAGGTSAGGMSAGGTSAGGTTSSGGAAGDPTGGGGGPPTWTCNGDHAYWATGTTIAFSDPTPSGLATALAEVSSAAHPISLVLHTKNGVFQAGLSATVQGGGGKDIFPANEVPPFAPVVAAFGQPPGVTTAQPLAKAYLHLVDSSGPVELALTEVIWRAGQVSTCDDVTIEVQATIPASQLGVVLHLTSGSSTIGDLAGVSADGGVCDDAKPGACDSGSQPLHFTFQGVPMAFDFSTL